MSEDFDRIADLSGTGGWDHNVHYHAFLLEQLPLRLGEALEVGCGTGQFARSLAERCERVLAIDLSPRMIEVARDRSKEHANIEYAVADANSWEFPEERFDCVASITTLHHLPLAPTLARIRDALKPGGTLLVLDLYQVRSVGDYLVGALGFPASKALKLAKTGRLSNRQSPELRRAWEEHGATDRYPTLAEVRGACAEAGLRGAKVRRHLLWRYSLVWRKPDS
ncbi:class I SAM-dependent methyltransferase [Rubrobacter tropicus]|uniref:class I SAM-dependent methyltransferase n=1 Tax=Rubrobacter tropicus TaxID=2653851 RepID=UPI001A9E6DB5|nr:class I SAM-dependent methyltransferase [Rubrobacter tropicus]